MKWTWEERLNQWRTEAHLADGINAKVPAFMLRHAVEYVDLLKETLEWKEKLLVCYRLGSFGRADKILTRLEQLEESLSPKSGA